MTSTVAIFCAYLTKKVDDYFAWIKLKYSQVTKSSAIGKALAYSIHQEQYLRLFLTNGNIPMENNLAEQAIRPFTIGRKNFVMINSSNGAQASAIIYSLVETAKANHLNVYQYFELLLTEIPKHMDDNNLDFIDSLLPWSPMVQKNALVGLRNLNFQGSFIFSKTTASPAQMRVFHLLWYMYLSTYLLCMGDVAKHF